MLRETGIREQVDAGVLTLTLDRAEKRNALDTEMLQALESALAPRAEVRAVVIRAEGAAFAAGADIGVYATSNDETLDAFTALANRVVDAIAALPVPVVAAVQGLALGGGFELVLAADIALATPAASFGLPELRLGLIPGWGGTQRLADSVGPRRALHLILTSGRIDAAAALELGLVAEIVDTSELDARAAAIARTLATGPARAIAAAKTAVRGRRAEEGYGAERALLSELFRSDDGREGVRAFVEKRPPRFA
ncbi:MAG: enoyl-CoA hydratase/isomerase family protein [Microbacterium sp.]|uniref:enoyl-CoA hydratase/isomerase family protein n=1 Tax=Microbacterium sp. TaxID=51671 RepID=UPI003F806E0F